ncbi:hypothetical protein, partial [Agrobacterium salinitolerans]|uniref:hypothetical protein n=1 Tax=Agrobacterium salinitolerans TaxID=1183413 RepID=UPI0035ADC00C
LITTNKSIIHNSTSRYAWKPSRMTNHAQKAADPMGRRRRLQFVLKPVVIAGIAAAATAATGAGNLSSALAGVGGAVFGSNWKDIGSAVADMFSGGLAFNRKQRETMTRHPMAYMYELARVR